MELSIPDSTSSRGAISNSNDSIRKYGQLRGISASFRSLFSVGSPSSSMNASKKKSKYPSLNERVRPYQMFGTSTTTASPLEVVTNGEASLRALENLVILILNGDRPNNNIDSNNADPFSLTSMNSMNSVTSQIINPMSPLGGIREGDERDENILNNNMSNREQIGPDKYESIMDAFYYSTELYDIYKNILEYLRKSTLYTFWEGSTIGSHEIDSAMGTFTIVNAVVLEIPFNVIGNMNYTFWDWLESSLNDCGATSGLYSQIAAYVQNSMYVVVYSSICGIMISIFYFILRPTDVAKFAVWWRRGRWVVLLSILYTLVSILAIVTVFSLITQAYVESTVNICSIYSGTTTSPLNFSSSYIAAFVAFSISIALVFLMMI